MASGARSPPSEETPDGRRIALATWLRLPPPRRRSPAPSRGEPGGRAARTPRAAGPAATSPPPPPLRLSDSVGPLNERRLVAHLRLALGREARLWRGGHPQVPVPAAGPSREHLHPHFTRARDAAGPHLHPRSGEPLPGAGTQPQAKGLLPLSRRLLPLVHRDQPPATFPAIPPPPLEQVELSGALQEVVLQLRRLGNLFLFSHSTLNLALTTCCRLLASGTVRESLLHIVTVTCLRLAAKINEEEELIPRTEDFIKFCGSDCTPSELLRMELAILDKLHWDLCIGTPLDFLNIFHALVVVGWPHVVELLPQRNPSLHVASLTKQLQHCMAGHQLLQFKGSTLALVIITLELERLMPDWCAPISDLLKKAQVGIEQFVHCRMLVKRQLRSVESPS